MKKIYYLLVVSVLGFAACQKQPELAPETYTRKGMQITLPTTTTFTSTEDAKSKIPDILSSTYPQLGNGSSGTVTFTISPVKVTLIDSLALLTKISYTATADDYKAVLGATAKFLEFNNAQAIAFLAIKYPKPTTNQLSFLTYTYYESGVTPSAVEKQTDTFLYLNGVWVKCYTLTAAQYASTGHPFGDFSSTDDAMLPTYFNLLLKSDILVSASTMKGDVKYVSFKYFSSKNYQHIIALTFDGTNWVTTPTTGSLSFGKSNGKWVLDAAINYKLVKEDYTYIGTKTTAGTVAGRASVAKFPDFNTSAEDDEDYWSDKNISDALIAVLTSKYKSTAITDQIFIVTYADYKFGKTTDASKSFTYDGSAFGITPPPAE